MRALLQCPRCSEVWEYESPPGREFLSAYCLCSSASDARRSETHTGVRMIVLEAPAAEPVLVGS